MWRTVLRPEVLFLIATVQALMPYLFFALWGTPEGFHFQLSYYPMAIWIIGYLCFWIGTRLGPRNVVRKVRRTIPISFSILKTSLVCLLLISVVEMVGLIQVYGGIPLLGFASGEFDVDSTNSAQSQSVFGQVGAAALTVYLLIGVITLIAIKAKWEKERITRWTIGPLLFTLLLSAFNGKRQGMLMCIFVIATCSTLVFGNPVELLSSFVPLKMRKRGNMVIALVLAVLIMESLSGLVALRTLGTYKKSASEGLILYYEWPIMNMSQQSIEAGGFGPYELKPLAVFASLLPAKVSLEGSGLESEVPRIVPSSPSGFYEKLQWNTGLWGVIPFCVFCGILAQYTYRLAFSRNAALLTYAFMAWALYSAPLYNHFLNLMFLPLPAVIFFAVSTVHREIRGSVIGTAN